MTRGFEGFSLSARCLTRIEQQEDGDGALEQQSEQIISRAAEQSEQIIISTLVTRCVHLDP